jgi:glycosyltransferase involved in cell wall biosynthesis
MKIFCLIDSLGSGGAQRQLVTLAVGLKKRGHQIRFLVYHEEDHFLPQLQEADIPCQVVPPCSYVQRVLAVRKILRQGWQDVVLVFLEAFSLYAELASFPSRSWGLVVGERSANPDIKKGIRRLLRQFHRMADTVVCNSHTNQLMLEKLYPFLINILCTVYNTVDFRLFIKPANSFNNGFKEEFRIVVAASYIENKNMMNVAKAILCLKNMRTKHSIVIDWFGAIPDDSKAFKKLERFIAENNLSDSLRLHSATREIANEFICSDAIGLFSFYEGLPNVICEGMACGKPILLSNVCDSSNLVHDGKNGFLCDPNSPEDIAEKILCMLSLSEQEQRLMGKESRKMAEQLFDENVVIERYEELLSLAVKHKPLHAGCSWPTNVPESAQMTINGWI